LGNAPGKGRAFCHGVILPTQSRTGRNYVSSDSLPLSPKRNRVVLAKE
jgi:hypothetical protein